MRRGVIRTECNRPFQFIRCLGVVSIKKECNIAQLQMSFRQRSVERQRLQSGFLPFGQAFLSGREQINITPTVDFRQICVRLGELWVESYGLFQMLDSTLGSLLSFSFEIVQPCNVGVPGLLTPGAFHLGLDHSRVTSEFVLVVALTEMESAQ